MLIGSIVTGMIAYFLNSYYTGKRLGYSSWMQIKDVAPSYGMALLIAISVYFLKYLPVSNWLILPLQILIGVMMFFFVCNRTKLQEYVELKEIAVKSFSKFLRHGKNKR